MKRKKKYKGWYWSCGWSSSCFGGMHADYEECSAKGRNPFKTESAAKKAGEKHMANHGYHGIYCNCHSHNITVYQK